MNNTPSRNKQKRRRPEAATAGNGGTTSLRNNGFKPKGRPQANNRRTEKVRKTIDVKLLTKAAMHGESSEFTPVKTFAEMPLSPRVQSALRHKGYTHPTEIQLHTIQHLLDGRDVLGVAQTGTGKTGAFLIPLIDRMIEGRENVQTLVIVPTRELAQQVSDEFRSLTNGLQLHSTCLIGGTNINRDIFNLRRKSDLIVGTPGRLLDLAKRGILKLAGYPVLILDEFDRMLDMGFAPDVQRLTDLMTNRRQTLLFSATVDKTQKRMIDAMLKDPVEVRISTGAATGDHIEQDIVRVKADENKFDVLLNMLSDNDFEKVLLFAETKRTVDRMNKMLKKSGVAVDQIHGDKSQGARQKALDSFKAGKIQVLVATDVAARGIDVSDVTHVINYQIPQTYDSYLHRIGRTGRAGKQGKAFTFVN
jgi:ATP-dependent RNA helicase RhlE